MEDSTAPAAKTGPRASDRAGDPSANLVLRAQDLTKVYAATAKGAPSLPLFKDLHLRVDSGESVAIVGQSGAGKSSLLHLLAGLDRPTSGEVWLRETRISDLDPDASAKLRNRAFGFVWQFHYLLPEFTALENIALPRLAAGAPRKEALAEAAGWLDRVELSDRAHHRSGELSGGEQQRVAIARALITSPEVLLADEPTGDLDGATASHLFDLLQRLCTQGGLAAVIVTHNLELAARCDRVLRLRGGRLEPAAG